MSAPSPDCSEPAQVGGRPGRASGMRRVNVEPRPSSLHTVTEPPWLLATCLTMARPRPVPPVLLARDWSTR